LSSDFTTMEAERQKEAKPEDIRLILRYLYPGLRIKNVRKSNQRTDWTIYANIDDKTDLYLGETGNISIDESTLKDKDQNLIQLFVNPKKFPGYYLAIKNSWLNTDEIITYATNNDTIIERVTGTNNETYKTRTFIVPVEIIKLAIIHSYPSIEWWCRRRT